MYESFTAESLVPILPNILEPCSLNLLAGASGLGKTALIASIAVALREGRPVFGHTPDQPAVGVGYVTTDRSWRSAKQWFTAAGYPEIPHYSLVDDKSFDLKQLHGGKHGPDQFEHCVEQMALPPGSLIIIDPIALYLGGKLNDYTTVAIAALQIQRYLERAGYTALGICHTSKQKADVQDRYARPQDRILGSGALLGYSWTQMYFMSPEEAGRDDNQFVFSWNPHHAPPAEFLLKRDMTTGLFDVADAYEVLTYTEDAQVVRQGRTTRGLDTLLSCFPPHPQTLATADLVIRMTAAAHPVSRASLFRYLSLLQTDGHIECLAHGVWRRCENAPAQLGGES